MADDSGIQGRQHGGRRVTLTTTDPARGWAPRPAEDIAWDEFQARAPGSHYMQSSIWARFKASFGWGSARLLVHDDDRILAGVQLLTGSVPVLGGVAYAARGPVDTSGDLDVGRRLLNELHRFCRTRRVRYLALQPASYSMPIAHELVDWGYQPTTRVGPATATLRVDLTPEPEEILAGMSKSTRRNVRRGQARGLTAREGTVDDLPAFYRLLSAASRRKGIKEFPEHYYLEMWRILAPRGHLKLFIVESDDEPVSAQLGILFGDAMHGCKMAWSGRYGDRKPNELLDWTSMMAAKAAGYSYFDFEGVDREAAKAAGHRAASKNAPTPEADSMATSYKFGFGGHIALLPETHDYVYNPLLRWAYHRALPRIEQRVDLSRPLKRLKHMAGGEPG